MYVWKGVEQYKNDVLKLYQKKLAARGIKNAKIYVAQLVQENGKLEPERLGDWQCNGLRGGHCSFGIIQYNSWAKHGMSAEAFLKKHPEWKTTDRQLSWMADEVAQRQKDYRSEWSRIVDHNCPACAVNPNSPKWGPIGRRYYKAVSSRLPLLTSL